jgi:hypothetical protein
LQAQVQAGVGRVVANDATIGKNQVERTLGRVRHERAQLLFLLAANGGDELRLELGDGDGVARAQRDLWMTIAPSRKLARVGRFG